MSDDLFKLIYKLFVIALIIVCTTGVLVGGFARKNDEKREETIKNYIKFVDDASTETITNALNDISKLDKKDLKEPFDKKKKKKLEKYYNNTEDKLEKIMILEILEREYNENVEIERNRLIKKGAFL